MTLTTPPAVPVSPLVIALNPAVDAEWRVREVLPEEKNEPDLAEMPRLILHPHQRNFGRLRMMLDAINEAELEEQEK